MIAWWESLNTLQHMFYYCAIPATILLVIQTILTIIGIGGDSDIDVSSDIDIDGDIDVPADMNGEFDGVDADNFDGADGLRFFTIRGIVAFFTMFGWVGIVLSNSELAIPLILIIAVGSGLAGMVFTAYLFYLITKLQYSGNINLKNALGQIGQVYIPIPGKMSGKGKIHINIQESLTEVDAMTEENEKLKTGSMVLVTDVMDERTVIVEAVVK